MAPDPGPDYILEPRDEDMGTRGRFSSQARTSSRQLELTKVVPDWAAGRLSAAAGHAFGVLQKRLGG